MDPACFMFTNSLNLATVLILLSRVLNVEGLKCYICTENEIDKDCWDEPEEYTKKCPPNAIGCQTLYFHNHSKVQPPFQRDCLLEVEAKCLFGNSKGLMSDGVKCGRKVFPTSDHYKEYYECRFELIPEWLMMQPLPIFKNMLDDLYADMSFCFCLGHLCNGKELNDRFEPIKTTSRPPTLIRENLHSSARARSSDACLTPLMMMLLTLFFIKLTMNSF